MSSYFSQIEMTKIILDRPESSQILDLQDRFGETPLHLAFHKMNSKIVFLLLSRGADIERKNKKGQKPPDIMNTIVKEKQIKFLESLLTAKLPEGTLKALEAKRQAILLEIEEERLRKKARENQKLEFEKINNLQKTVTILKKRRKEFSIVDELERSIEENEEDGLQELDYEDLEEDPTKLLSLDDYNEFLPNAIRNAEAFYDQTLKERNFFYDNIELKIE